MSETERDAARDLAWNVEGFFNVTEMDEDYILSKSWFRKGFDAGYLARQSEIARLRADAARYKSVINQLAYYTSEHSETPCNCDQCNIYKIVEAASKEKQ